jgi:ubiquinone/menaquinone biosynthesis C-methylase UbiE
MPDAVPGERRPDRGGRPRRRGVDRRMTSSPAFSGSIPDLYDRTLVPLWFAPFAADLAARVAALAPQRLLEVAAGTGALTRALVEAVPGAHIEATDLSLEMLARASSRTETPRVRWSVADAARLTFPDASFDLVACQFAVMFFDRPAAFREARRVLSPGGTYLFNVWDRLDANDVARVAHEAIVELYPEDPPQFFARVPHGHADPVPLERQLREAGFARVEYEAVAARSRHPSVHGVAVAICEGTPIRHELVARDPVGPGAAIQAVERALRRAYGDGDVGGALRAFVFAARAS